MGLEELILQLHKAACLCTRFVLFRTPPPKVSQQMCQMGLCSFMHEKLTEQQRKYKIAKVISYISFRSLEISFLALNSNTFRTSKVH